MKIPKVKLTKEQLKQLAEANAEALEKDIMNLQKLCESKDVNFQEFWQKSNKIHKIFKKITPIEKVDRERLWDLFLNVRLMVKQRQEKERVLKQILKERTIKEIFFLVSDAKDLIVKENKEAYEVEMLMFFIEKLESLLKGDFSSLPDTPETAFVAVRLKKLKFDENIRKEILNTLKVGRKCLNKIADKKYRELKESIIKIANEMNKVPPLEINRHLKSIYSEITGSYLLKQQKDKLKKSIVLILGKLDLKGKEFESLNELKTNLIENKEKSREKTESEKMKEIKILLEEIEQSILKQS